MYIYIPKNILLPDGFFLIFPVFQTAMDAHEKSSARLRMFQAWECSTTGPGSRNRPKGHQKALLRGSQALSTPMFGGYRKTLHEASGTFRDFQKLENLWLPLGWTITSLALLLLQLVVTLQNFNVSFENHLFTGTSSCFSFINAPLSATMLSYANQRVTQIPQDHASVQ